MFDLSSDITIGKFKFDYCCEVVIESDIENLTDTCTITIPRKLVWQGKNISELIKRKDQVTVFLGYDGNLIKEFTGYVKDIKSSTPLVIVCEDEMFTLKTKVVSRKNTVVKLKDLLTEFGLKGFKAVDVSLGKLQVKSASVAKVLEELKGDYGLYSYFKKGVLHSGLAYWVEGRAREVFKFGLNIIESDLEFKIAEDTRIKVVAIGIKSKNNKRTRVEVGDEDGDIRTLHKQNVGEADLKVFANNELKKLKYSGFKGTFKTFGYPSVTKGDVAVFQDPNYPEKDGSYLIRAVKKNFDTNNGYKQVVAIGEKIA